MENKIRAKEIQAFSKYRSADGSEGVTRLEAGIQFKNGLFVGGTFSAAALPITTNNITINGTAGNGYIQYGAQTVAPSLALVHTYADSGGHFAIGRSGSSGFDISFTNGFMTANRDYAFQDKSGTLAMTNDNISEFTNDAGYVLGTRNLTAGAGLTGGGTLAADRTFDVGAGLGITVNANDIALTTPGTLTVATSNNASGSHTHAITSSANPGAAASLLATDSSGFVRLVRLGIGTAPTQPLHVAGNAFIDASTANLYMKDTSTGLQVSATGIISPQSGNALRNTGFTSGVSGWNQSNNGDAEFNNVRIRGELAASVFKVSELSATAGTFGVFYSASTLAVDCLTAASPGSGMVIVAKNSDAGGMLFAVNDVVRIKSWTGAAISDAWATISSRTNNGTTTTYNAVFNSGSASTTFPAGTAVIDYGPSGTGFITLSTDGTVGSSPNLTMATHAGAPWSTFTNLLRLGNLNGSYGYATDIYGLGVGNSTEYLTVDPANGLRLAAAAGHATLDASGLALDANISGYVNTNSVNWNYSGTNVGHIYTSYITSGTPVATFLGKSILRGADSTGEAWFSLRSENDTASQARFDLIKFGSTASANAGKSYCRVYDASGLLIGLTIGSSSLPTHMLDVYGTGWFQGAVSLDAGIAASFDVATGTHNTKIKIGPAAAMMQSVANADQALFGRNAYYDGTNWKQPNSGHASAMRIETDGGGLPFVGFHVSASGGSAGGTLSSWDSTNLKLSVKQNSTIQFNQYGAGTLSTDASGNITATSDERLKIIKGDFRKGLAEVKNLRPIRYRWRKESGLDRTQEYVGFGAQQTKKHIPEAVGKGLNGFHTMNHNVIIAALVNAVKELEDKYELISHRRTA